MKIFTIHHVASSGGSICSQFFAACSKAILISEVYPKGKVILKNSVGYSPGNPMALYLQNKGEDLSPKLKEKYFLRQLELIIEDAACSEKNLLIREHTHSCFPFKEKQQKRLGILGLLSTHEGEEILKKRNLIIPQPLLTVRHPLDSFISSRKRNWHKNYSDDGSLDAYCRALLNLYEVYSSELNAVIMRYEDLCINQKLFAQKLRKKFDLHEFSIPSEQEVNLCQVTGKSGRKSQKIQFRPRQNCLIDKDLELEIASSKNYDKACNLQGYNPDPNSLPISKTRSKEINWLN